jgi:hypothetical protein
MIRARIAAALFVAGVFGAAVAEEPAPSWSGGGGPAGAQTGAAAAEPVPSWGAPPSPPAQAQPPSAAEPPPVAQPAPTVEPEPLQPPVEPQPAPVPVRAVAPREEAAPAAEVGSSPAAEPAQEASGSSADAQPAADEDAGDAAVPASAEAARQHPEPPPDPQPTAARAQPIPPAPPARPFNLWFARGIGGSGTPDILLGAALAFVPGGPVRVELNAFVGAQSDETDTPVAVPGDTFGAPYTAAVSVDLQAVELAVARRTGPFELWGSVGVFSAQANASVTGGHGSEDFATGSSTRGLTIAAGCRLALGSRLLLGVEVRHFAEGRSTFDEAPLSVGVGGTSLLAGFGFRLGPRAGDR